MTLADATSAVRVLLVDDEPLIRSGFQFILAAAEGIEVVGEAADGAAAIEFVRARRPDVVLMDVRMPVLDGVAATRELTEHAPQCRIVMLTTFDDEEYVVRALRAGASGYLLKDRPAAALVGHPGQPQVFIGLGQAALVRRARILVGGKGREGVGYLAEGGEHRLLIAGRSGARRLARLLATGLQRAAVEQRGG